MKGLRPWVPVGRHPNRVCQAQGPTGMSESSSWDFGNFVDGGTIVFLLGSRPPAARPGLWLWALALRVPWALAIRGPGLWPFLGLGLRGA